MLFTVYDISLHTKKLNNKTSLFLTFVIALLHIGVLAQNKYTYIVGGASTAMVETSSNYKTTSLYYSYWDMDTDFKYGIIYLKNGDSIDNLGLRYNITTDRFEAVSNVKKGIYNVNPDAISHIRRMSEQFSYYKFYNNKGVLKKGYFKIIYDGDTKLLYRKTEIRKEGKNGAFGYSAYKNFESNYYIKKANETYPISFKKKKKSVLEIFSDRKSEIETFCLKNTLRYSNINDLIQIFTYYDNTQEVR